MSPHAAQRERWLFLGTLEQDRRSRKPGEPPQLRRWDDPKPAAEPRHPATRAPAWHPTITPDFA